MLRYYKVLFLLLCIVSSGYAQKNAILLHSGTMQPSPNLEEFIQLPSPNDVVNGYYYRLLQFNAIPNAQQKSSLKSDGVILLDYIPQNTFMAAIPVRYDRNNLKNVNVRSVLRMQDVQKINRNILGAFPDYCVKLKGYADITVQYQGNIAHDVALRLAAPLGNILSSNAKTRVIDLRIRDNSLNTVAAQNWVFYVSAIAAPSFPEDTKGRSLHRSNVINSAFATGRHYDGTGVVAGLADDGFVGPHIDFTGRIFNYATGSGSTHGDMTSGILAGAGNLDPEIKGMGSGAFLYVYNIGGYNHIVDAVNNYSTLGTVITSTSYSQGCNEYTTDTQFGDQLINENKQIVFVFSAGNNGSGNCNYGAGGGWGNITGGYKQGKNIIACGNLDALEVLDPSSSRGPASDGRVKPDICANGRDQLSTDENNTYQVGGGTSAACPSVAGVLTQLYQAYKELNGGAEPQSALIKACVLNGAEDIGNPGPDFTYGWGRINALRAIQTLEDDRYLLDSIDNGGANTHQITVPAGVNEVRVMVYWNDTEGSPAASVSLVNDINITMTDPSANVYEPWILNSTPNSAALSANAVRGVDSLNNMEQVTLSNPAAGVYTITVDGYSIPSGPQEYFLVYEFRTNDITVTYPFGGEGFEPGTQEVIRWDAVKGLGNFVLDYSTDNGASWTTINNNINQSALQYTWTVPNTITHDALIRVSRGADSDVSDTTFRIVAVPQNISVDWTCPDSVRLTWSPVNGATGYTVYVLGAKYMDAVGTSTTTDFIITGINPMVEHWYSVSAQVNGLDGRRANAIYQGPGLFGCPLAYDANALSMASPTAGILQDCQDNSSITVSFVFENAGQNPISNIPVSYQLNNGTIVTDIIAGPVTPLGQVVYNFNTAVDLSATGTYTLTLWTGLTGDLNNYNDTITTVITVVSGTLLQLPVSENFESYTTCTTASGCEANICPLGTNWMNEENVNRDDIDFRVNSGSTPSTATGPDVDHTTGNASGKYVYLESSGSCNGKTALLTSACIDLTNSNLPQMTFWYHMYGSNMGSVAVDIYSQGTWDMNVLPAISGNQGNQWLQASVNLAPYAGEIINVRIRAITGSDFTSDLAIDDILISESASAPAVAFNADITSGCPGTTVNFTDLSANAPTTWEWIISPASFTYVNGTDSSSQNPVVMFNAAGNYSVTLNATNGFGMGTATQNSYINILSAAATPVQEAFQSGVFPPAGWREFEAGGTHSWDTSIVTGSNGLSTTAAWVNNFAYDNVGEEDGIATFEVDLTAALSPLMTFDVSYARYSANFSDGLRVDISTDCGETFAPSGYLKTGTVLATVPDNTNDFFPTAGADWRNDTLMLGTWIGQEIVLKFVNINGYGNNLFIDNVNIQGAVGLSDQASLANVHVYPNPTSGLVTLDMFSQSQEEYRLDILDMQGRNLRTERLLVSGSLRHRVSLAGNGAGIYLLRVTGQNGAKTIRVVVL